jgi:hypothetical protein
VSFSNARDALNMHHQRFISQGKHLKALELGAAASECFNRTPFQSVSQGHGHSLRSKLLGVEALEKTHQGQNLWYNFVPNVGLKS